jgi:hypothetical protein
MGPAGEPISPRGSFGAKPRKTDVGETYSGYGGAQLRRAAGNHRQCANLPRPFRIGNRVVTILCLKTNPRVVRSWK